MHLRVLVIIALSLAGCGGSPQGNGRTPETCPSSIDHLGNVLAGSCGAVGNTCTYGTSEWDFACACVETPRGARSWRCCSTDTDYGGYRQRGCYSDSTAPLATGWPCCGACTDVAFLSGQVCSCVDNLWQCNDPGDGGTD